MQQDSLLPFLFEYILVHNSRLGNHFACRNIPKALISGVCSIIWKIAAQIAHQDKKKSLNFNCTSVVSASDANDEIGIVQAQAISEIHCETRSLAFLKWRALVSAFLRERKRIALS
jgi:hypothetical protein